MRRSHSSIRICSKAGGVPERKYRTFSPLADEAPAADSDAVWLPGGYPELHAGALASADRFKHGMRELAARDIPMHGECGGYMVLGAGLETADGQRHEMLGLLGLETSFRQRRLHLGYRRARLLPNSAAALGGERAVGTRVPLQHRPRQSGPAAGRHRRCDGRHRRRPRLAARHGHGHLLPPDRRYVEKRRSRQRKDEPVTVPHSGAPDR